MTTAQIVEVTPMAAERLDAILKEQGGEGSMLRVMVMPSPHGGMQYSMGVESEARADDFVIEAENIRVLIDPESAPLVEGAQIDYVDGLMRSGFTISNPNEPAAEDAPAAAEAAVAEEAAGAAVAAAVVDAAAAATRPTRDLSGDESARPPLCLASTSPPLKGNLPFDFVDTRLEILL